MGCGNANSTKNKNIDLLFQERKKQFFRMEEEFRIFLSNNHSFESEIRLLDNSEVEPYINKHQEILDNARVDKKVAYREIQKILTLPMIEKSKIANPTYETFIELMDKFNQLDSDMRIVKEITSNDKNFPKQSKGNKAFFLDFTKLNIYQMFSTIDVLKYQYCEKIEHLSIHVPLNVMNNGRLFIEMTDLVEKCYSMRTFIFAIVNQPNQDYLNVNINVIEPLLIGLKQCIGISNLAIGCINCKGEVNDRVQESFSYLLNDETFSFGLSNIQLNFKTLVEMAERVVDQKKIKLFFYEPQEDLQLKEKHIILNKLSETLMETLSLQMIYLCGFDDCTQDLKTYCINQIRKNGVVRNMIIDVPFRDILRKFLDN